MKKKLVLILLVVFSSSLFPLYAKAEFICRSELSYKWQAGEEEEAEEEHWMKIERKGKAESDAKKDLEIEILAEKEKALISCQRKYENFAGCIAAKHSSMENVINLMSFTARKSLEEAIAEDCKQNQGKCLGVNIKEIACEEIKLEEKESKTENSKEEKKKK